MQRPDPLTRPAYQPPLCATNHSRPASRQLHQLVISRNTQHTSLQSAFCRGSVIWGWWCCYTAGISAHSTTHNERCSATSSASAVQDTALSARLPSQSGGTRCARPDARGRDDAPTGDQFHVLTVPFYFRRAIPAISRRWADRCELRGATSKGHSTVTTCVTGDPPLCDHRHPPLGGKAVVAAFQSWARSRYSLRYGAVILAMSGRNASGVQPDDTTSWLSLAASRDLWMLKTTGLHVTCHNIEISTVHRRELHYSNDLVLRVI